MTYRKKLIEVALPLNAINDASAYDKMPGIGPHPKNLHWWWARLPLPAARVFLFASVVDDPEEDGVPIDLLKKVDELSVPRSIRSAVEKLSVGEIRRHKLLGFVERLASASHKGGDIEAIEIARSLIDASCEGKKPLVVDPFSGGGSIPVEAARLGFDVVANDLNPVAVLIGKGQLDLPAEFANQPPLHPIALKSLGHGFDWRGYSGLVEDVRRYAQDIEIEAKRRIGNHYPNVKANGQESIPLTYVWCRTIPSPNPAARGALIPIIRSFVLSKKGRSVWSQAKLDDLGQFQFTVHEAPKGEESEIPARTAPGKERNRPVPGRCLITGQLLDEGEVRETFKTSHGPNWLTAIVVQSGKKRGYVGSSEDPEQASASVISDHSRADMVSGLALDLPKRLTGGSVVGYGLTKFADLFTDRQLLCLTTFSDLTAETFERIVSDARAGGLSQEKATKRGQAICTYLAYALGRLADFNNTSTRWAASGEQQKPLFARQAIPMVWDFCETNPFAPKGISWSNMVELVVKALEKVPAPNGNTVMSQQGDAAALEYADGSILTSTDPPYYSSISYADLSDFFYGWHRRTLRDILPDLYGTMATPKAEELIAHPSRHGGVEAAARHFEDGFGRLFGRMRSQLDPRFPLTIYYAFKQSEGETGDEEDGDAESAPTNRGWETILQALLDQGFEVTGTLPVRAAQNWRMVSMGTNAVASYIVLVCRPRRSTDTATRRSFLSQLRNDLPEALSHLQGANIAPVDLSQAVLGPGISIFSRFNSVLETDGKPMRVRAALALINEVLAEIMEGQEGTFDATTRFAIAWFQSHGFEIGEFDDALKFANRYNVPINAMERDGALYARGGDVRLRSREELSEGYEPATDKRVTVWEATQHLVKALDKEGELGAARVMRRFRDGQPQLDLDRARELAYRLWAICNQKRWAQEARVYNALVLSWSDIEAVSQTEEANWSTLPEARNLFTE